jgi:hypothetical protein
MAVCDVRERQAETLDRSITDQIRMQLEGDHSFRSKRQD